MQAIRIKQGDSGTVDFTVLDPATGEPVDIEGATLEFFAATPRDFSPSVSFYKFNAEGIEITDAANGAGYIEFLASETAPVAGWAGVPLTYDLRVSMPSGDVWTVSSGSLYLAPSAANAYTSSDPFGIY